MNPFILINFLLLAFIALYAGLKRWIWYTPFVVFIGYLPAVALKIYRLNEARNKFTVLDGGDVYRNGLAFSSAYLVWFLILYWGARGVKSLYLKFFVSN